MNLRKFAQTCIEYTRAAVTFAPRPMSLIHFRKIRPDWFITKCRNA